VSHPKNFNGSSLCSKIGLCDLVWGHGDASKVWLTPPLVLLFRNYLCEMGQNEFGHKRHTKSIQRYSGKLRVTALILTPMHRETLQCTPYSTKECLRETLEYTQIHSYEDVGGNKKKNVMALGAAITFYDKNISLLQQQNRLCRVAGRRANSRPLKLT